MGKESKIVGKMIVKWDYYLVFRVNAESLTSSLFAYIFFRNPLDKY